MNASRGWALSAPGAPALLACALFGCLRPSEERTLQDLEVGRAELPEVAVEVQDGRAAVRALEPARLVLWASAPRFELTLTWPSAPTELVLEVQNCMPDARAEVQLGSATL